MSIFDRASKKVTETVKDLQKKTNESMAIKKFESQIKSTEAEIEGVYRAIGEAAYAQHVKGAALEGFEEFFASVTALKERVAKFESEIDKLNDVKRCSGCGQQVQRMARFCPHCGAKLEIIKDEPEPEPEPEEEVPSVELCPNCGSERRGSAQFCETCGHDFEAGSSEPAAEEEAPAHEE